MESFAFSWLTRIDVELNPDEVFAALAGTTHLTGGVLDERGATFDLGDGERVWISRAALGLPDA